jgi:hypothetical protein
VLFIKKKEIIYKNISNLFKIKKIDLSVILADSDDFSVVCKNGYVMKMLHFHLQCCGAGAAR